jgi:hypothetical protein
MVTLSLSGIMITANDIAVIYALAGENVSTAGKLKEGEVHPRVLQFTQDEYDELDSSLSMQQKALILADLPDDADVRLMINENA